jgi:uncharacterized membrane protein YbhN (UPF0104 family)
VIQPVDVADGERSRVARIVFNRRVVRVVGLLVIVGLVYYAFFVVLPSEISWSQVWEQIQALSVLELVALVASGLLVMVALGWTSKASLPGLSLYQGFESSATSQMTAFVVPPPGDLLVRFGMYRTYGYSHELAGTAILIAMVARYLAIAFMLILGLVVVVVTGEATTPELWLLIALALVFGIVMWALLKVVRSDPAAHLAGRALQRVATPVARLIHRTAADDLEQSVVSFSVKTRNTVQTNGLSLIASNVGWGVSNFLVMLLCLRFTGVTSGVLTGAGVGLATGLVMVLNVLPIPGKDALAASWLASVLAIPSADQSALVGALLLFRVITWVLPMPVGGLAFLAWRWRVRRDTVRGQPPDKVVDVHTQPTNDEEG